MENFSVTEIPETGIKTFIYHITASIGDTNMEGNVYWTNYAIWFGKAREAFLMHVFPEFTKVFAAGYHLITREFNIKYHHPIYFAEEINLEINMTKIRHTSAIMLVKYTRNGVLVAEAWQELVFCDPEGKCAPIPPLREAVLKYAI